MQRLEVSGAVRPLQLSLGVKGLIETAHAMFRIQPGRKRQHSDNENCCLALLTLGLSLKVEETQEHNADTISRRRVTSWQCS